MNHVIEIFLSGLILLVPHPERMEALLVNTVGIHVHIPSLAFRYAGDCRAIDARLCSRVGRDFCECRLAGFDVTFDPPSTETGPLLRRPEMELPEGDFSAAQPEWLVRMANVDGVEEVPIKASIEGKVASRVTFGWQRMQNCTFDELNRRVHKFEFVDPGTGRRASRHEQALSELVVFHGGLDRDSFEVVLTERQVPRPRRVRIRFDCPERKCPPLLIGNLRRAAEEDEDSSLGMDFKLYADLLEGSLGLVPHRLSVGAGTAAAGEVQTRRCRFVDEFLREANRDLASNHQPKSPLAGGLRHTLNGPVICPMALADPSP